MPIYDIVFLLTNPLCAFAVYILNRIFFLERRSSRIIEILTYILYTILLSIIFVFVRVPFVFLITNIVGFFMLSFNYESKIFKRVLNAFMLYLIMLIIEAIVWAGIGYFEIGMFEYNQFDSVIGVILTRVMSVSVAYIIYKYTDSKKEAVLLPWYYYVAHVLIIAGILWLFLFSLEQEDLQTKHVLFSSGILIVVIIDIILIDRIVCATFVEKHEVEIVKIQNEAYINQNEIIKQSVETIRTIRHDINNHMHSIVSMYENNNNDMAKEYVEEILDKINNANISKSDNFIIDSIINFKLRDLDLKVVETHINITVPENINIIAYDLTIILGNLLDNAIRAVQQTNGDKKLVIDITVSKSNLIILIDNTYSGKIIKNENGFISTKQIKDNHGMGIKNVKRTVEKYGGEIYINYSPSIFSVSVIIPYDN